MTCALLCAIKGQTVCSGLLAFVCHHHRHQQQCLVFTSTVFLVYEFCVSLQQQPYIICFTWNNSTCHNSGTIIIISSSGGMSNSTDWLTTVVGSSSWRRRLIAPVSPVSAVYCPFSSPTQVINLPVQCWFMSLRWWWWKDIDCWCWRSSSSFTHPCTLSLHTLVITYRWGASNSTSAVTRSLGAIVSSPLLLFPFPSSTSSPCTPLQIVLSLDRPPICTLDTFSHFLL